MATWKTAEPMADSEINARLAALKAARWDDDEAIGDALDGLLGDVCGRASLVEHLEDMVALATDTSLSDAQRGRWLRAHFEPYRPVTPRPGGLRARLGLAAARERNTA
jgi:hypothetical protein